jgi:hypothetical protein
VISRTGRRAGDADRDMLCQRLIAGKRSIAEQLTEGVDPAIRTTLAQLQA